MNSAIVQNIGVLQADAKTLFTKHIYHIVRAHRWLCGVLAARLTRKYGITNMAA